jgi:hypothetical protein
MMNFEFDCQYSIKSGMQYDAEMKSTQSNILGRERDRYPRLRKWKTEMPSQIDQLESGIEIENVRIMIQ